MTSLPREILNQLFNDARTHHGWLDKPVKDETLHQIYDLMKWCPTCVNGQPLRILFVRGSEAKEKLLPCLIGKNIEKTKAAPVTAIFAEDLSWYKSLPRLMPHADYFSHFADNKPLSESTSFRNSSLQAAYFILAARALGVDVGPMSGFDSSKVDEAFFKGTSWRSNFLCNLGYGDPTQLFPRSPRFEFEEACKII